MENKEGYILRMKVNESKVIFSNNIFKSFSKFLDEKNTIIITPLTKINELLNLKSNNILKKYIDNIDKNEFLKYEALSSFVKDINDDFGADILKFDVDEDKLLKLLLSENELIINRSLLNLLLNFYEKYSLNNLTIVIAGFDKSLYFVEKIFKHLNVVYITNKITNIGLTWSNIELLSFDTKDNFKVESRDGLKEWLELKTKTLLTIDDINKYLSGEINMNSFLIERSLKEL